MLDGKEIADKIAEYKSLRWLHKRYTETGYSSHNSDDLIPIVFRQGGAAGIYRTESKDTIETLIKNSAVHAIEGQILVLEGEFKRMKISLEGIVV